MFEESLIKYYLEFRTALFVTGFTLGTFLFTMKSAIIKTMLDDYYNNTKYQEQVAEARGLGSKAGYYDSLERFSNLLIWGIRVSFGSAILQISVGYWDNWIAILICLSSVIISWIVVAMSIHLVNENWKASFRLHEELAKERYESDSKC